ncbi:MAG: 5-oxoprolinase [Myxococcales bacterium]|nr:5-oxoprolinase [Myxococcales bacterium]
MGARWQFWIDRGGTFTDCIGVSPNGDMRSVKVLSSDRAPLEGIRTLLEIAADAPIPPCNVRMGTTLATNALLERRGTITALVISRGFRDLLAIGTQARPDLFALDIVKPEMLYREVLEVGARLDARGAILEEPGCEVREQLEDLLSQGIESLAIVVLHSYLDDTLERRIEATAREVGFVEVSCSSEVSAEMGLLGRGDTTVVDAYLTPLIRRYLEELQGELPESNLQIMQSSGGLTSASRFRGKNAVLSGPAGGVIAYTEIAKAAGFTKAIGFDMGGTSTDVSCFDGELERSYESCVAGVRLRAPMMSIHTVAAGGGSICLDNGFHFQVGPESAGAHPGPLCYGNAGAHSLTVTDCNLALGRVVDDRFPFSLQLEPVFARLEARREELAKRGVHKTAFEIAEGFIEIANSNMAAAIREVTTAKGRDLRDFALLVFGGAGGQHACAIARQLGVRTLIIDELAGVLSAYGMGLASPSWHGEADAGRRELKDQEQLEKAYVALETAGKSVLLREGAGSVLCIRRLDLRYRGTDSCITVQAGPGASEEFRHAHLRLYGFAKDEVVEMVTLRSEVVAPSDATIDNGEPAPVGPLSALRNQSQCIGGQYRDVPVYGREQLGLGATVAGPALILDATGTIALDEGFSAKLGAGNRLLLIDEKPSIAHPDEGNTRVDPIRLEIFGNLFMSTAVQMGNALRNTSVSTNIRERLDFSCAVFDADGGLVANAPHIPVHLGAMGESIRGILETHPNPEPGSVFASNDPNLGGSHLPDITVVTPIHDAEGKRIFFTASRGHHADVGGITPGSMPPFSTSISEEGVVLRAVQIVRNGEFDEDGVRAIFASGPYPARCIADNIADLNAQIAANQTGAALLRELLRERGAALTLAYMGHVQDNAAEQVAASILALPDGEYRFADAMDDGTPIEVCARVQGESLLIDFEGSGAQVRGNLNAPGAVTIAAVMYVLRCMAFARIPLNSGCLRSVEIRIPDGSILKPSAGAAVAAGNVETSQRVVDVLLAALGLSAASQGTMNNLTFGNESFGYYETIAGGAGASKQAPGASGVHTHMTNTRITDPEVLEARFPVRLCEFSLRRKSGGAGSSAGGDGLVREIQALAELDVSIISERRARAPFGLEGGHPGQPGRNSLDGKALPSKASFSMKAGQRLKIETPGGGGFGS